MGKRRNQRTLSRRDKKLSPRQRRAKRKARNMKPPKSGNQPHWTYIGS